MTDHHAPPRRGRTAAACGLAALLSTAALPALAAEHPLDPLDAAEITAAVAAVKDAGHAGDGTFFPTVELRLPPKADVLAWKPGDPITRIAHLVFVQDGDTFEAEVNLTEGGPPEVEVMDGVQPGILLAEWIAAGELTTAHPDWQAAMRKRGYETFDTVFCAPLSTGFFDTEEEQGRRLLRVPCYDLTGTKTTIHGRPIEGLFAIIDLAKREVVRIVDLGVVATPAGTNRVDEETLAASMRPAMKPVTIATPQGGNVKIDGHAVTWDRWSFRLKLDRRFGTMISLASWSDASGTRPILYEGYAAEMFVPYMDPSEAWYFRSYMDIGEYGFGLLSSALTPGIDCPADATFLGATINDDAGAPIEMPNIMCVFERPTGNPVWRHAEMIDASYEGRPEVELVVRTVPTVGNYDYVMDWVFTQRGELDIRVGATGMDATKGVVTQSMTDPTAAADTATGALLAPGIVGVYHDHYISFRLDLDVDGPVNSFVREAIVQKAVDAGTPRRSIWTLEPVAMATEGPVEEGHHGAPEVWKIINPEKRTGLGYHPGYQIEAHHSATSRLDPEDWPQKRAAFSGAPLWITAYADNERHAAGAYPNQSTGGDGLPAFVRDGQPIENTDIVAWYTMGFHHVTRPEDWPVLSTKWHEMKLRPLGFFDRSPAIDTPAKFATQ